jgi:plastocyanin
MDHPRLRRLMALALPAALLAATALVWSCSSSNKKSITGPGVPAADLTITITGINGSSSFSPNPATVTVGQTVAWRNSGGTTHTATADNGTAFNVSVNNGQTSAPDTMKTAGSFGYHCSIHPSMVGTLQVQAGP